MKQCRSRTKYLLRSPYTAFQIRVHSHQPVKCGRQSENTTRQYGFEESHTLKHENQECVSSPHLLRIFGTLYNSTAVISELRRSKGVPKQGVRMREALHSSCTKRLKSISPQVPDNLRSTGKLSFRTSRHLTGTFHHQRGIIKLFYKDPENGRVSHYAHRRFLCKCHIPTTYEHKKSVQGAENSSIQSFTSKVCKPILK